MDRAAYDALPNINWSRLKLLEKSPAHFKAGYSGDSSSLRLGTAAHAAVLEPEKFARDFVVYPGKVRRGKEWEKFEQEAIDAGKTCLSRTEYAEASEIAKSVRAHSAATRYLTLGEPEVGLVWNLSGGEFSFDCKGMLDYVGDVIVDLKSTRDGSPQGFAASCHRYGYYGQAAWYSDGLFRARGKRLPFYFVAVESEPPYLVSVYRVPEAIIEYGRAQYLSLLGKLDYFTKRNFWGGYSEADEMDLELPHWEQVQEEAA